MEPAEREKLANELEAQLEQFVDELSKNSSGYQDGWPEDSWEEEMDKHPFFMKQAPDLSSGELPPLLEGLARLKFDPENNTPEELAANYREDGNFYFKSKNFRLSIVSYTEGIKVNCNDHNLIAVLYNNRALSHYMLENYRSSLKDCEKAMSYKPAYKKSQLRAAKCAFKLLEFSTCIKYCDEMLSVEEESVAEKLKSECTKVLDELAEKEDRQNKILARLKSRGIKMFNPIEDIDNELDIFLNEMSSIEKPARLAECGKQIIWPVVILYPEYNIYDYYQEFLESTVLSKLVTEILSVRPEWDLMERYSPDTVNMYYIGRNMSDLYDVSLEKTLEEVMTEPKFCLRRMSPIFLIKPKT